MSLLKADTHHPGAGGMRGHAPEIDSTLVRQTVSDLPGLEALTDVYRYLPPKSSPWSSQNPVCGALVRRVHKQGAWGKELSACHPEHERDRDYEYM